MANISKQLAEIIAEDLLKQKYLKIKELGKKLNEIGTKLIVDTIPYDVLKCFESVKNRDFFKSRTNFCINSRFAINSIDYIPFHGYNCLLDVSKCSELEKTDSEIIKLKAEYNTELESIVNILLSLKTENRIITEFPDFKKYFTKECTSLCIPVDFIHNLIK